jgi:hypothetical protein
VPTFIEEYEVLALDNPFGLTNTQLAALGVGTVAAIGLAFYLLRPASAEAAGLSGESANVPPADKAQIETIAKAMYPNDFESVRWIRDKPEGYLARIMLKKPAKLQGLGPQVEILVALDYSGASVVREIRAFDSDAYKQRQDETRKLQDQFYAESGAKSPEVAAADLLKASNDLLSDLEEVRQANGALTPFSKARYAAWRSALLAYQKAAVTKASSGFSTSSWVFGDSGSKSYRPGLYQLTDIGLGTKTYAQGTRPFDSTLAFGYQVGVPQVLARQPKIAPDSPGFTAGYPVPTADHKAGMFNLLAFYKAWVRDTNRTGFTTKIDDATAKALGYKKPPPEPA